MNKVSVWAGLLLAVVLPARAEQTVCYAFERTFLAECGACPAGAELVSGPNKPVAGCKQPPLRDPRLISNEEGMARLPAAARKGIAAWQAPLTPQVVPAAPASPAESPAAAPAAPAAAPASPPVRPAPRMAFKLLSN